MDVIEVDCTTGDRHCRPLTNDEQAQRNTDVAAAEAEAQQFADEAAARATTLTKVAAAAGVSIAELRTALGVPHE
ncbi:hypothetical protein OU415_02275 [Saccharopolyspora sp. WRP15-2]|uniref:Uncharacterized protein n=1 Tax=Saccharopolyspora oryzae TaxID=2997343 RepID=A0ABT4URT3_9PSEU|nr:hypothetical protein [Saccharopolyspora oryzae]MDA3624243.1 hypothetical protein [Saccharopolyspora oryzae]